MAQFPVYILDDDTVLFPDKNMNHVEFWETEVCNIVYAKFGVKAKNYPYCQRRGRVVRDIFYYGEDMKKSLLAKIKRATGIQLRLVFDEHERRSEFDVEYFNAQKPKSTIT